MVKYEVRMALLSGAGYSVPPIFKADVDRALAKIRQQDPEFCPEEQLPNYDPTDLGDDNAPTTADAKPLPNAKLAQNRKRKADRRAHRNKIIEEKLKVFYWYNILNCFMDNLFLKNGEDVYVHKKKGRVLNKSALPRFTMDEDPLEGTSTFNVLFFLSLKNNR